MPRRTRYEVVFTQTPREAAREQRLDEAKRRRFEREAERKVREAQRQLAASAKEGRQRHLDDQQEKAENLNRDLGERLADLQNVLVHTLEVDDTIVFSSLRVTPKVPPFLVSPELANPAPKPNQDAFFKDVKKPGVLTGWLGMIKRAYEKRIVAAEEQYAKACNEHKGAEATRLARLGSAKAAYEQQRQAIISEADKRNQEISDLEAGYAAGEPQAVIAYSAMVLERSEYPDGFPQEFRLAYVPESKELVIEYELPGVAVVPQVADHKYNKTKDVIEERPKKPAEIRELYQDIVGAVAIRTIHEVFEADQKEYLATVVFNGFVDAVDPATGRDVRPCLISVRVTGERFAEIDLRRIDKRVCLRNLGAQVSPRPAEMQAVRPIIEFDMVDKRFTEQSDILADLESRPNLMELNPFEFENLVSNLFGKMGLETKQTRSTRDNGVDCVAFDMRPILGGKVVIQAKRWSNTVGVSAVRDLYGTMMNEGANKGILVATSGYGPDAYDFVKDKPIELIDGGGLLYLLKQQGVEARIVFLDSV